MSYPKEVRSSNNKRKIPNVERWKGLHLVLYADVFPIGMVFLREAAFLYGWVVCMNCSTTKSVNDATIFTSISYLTLSRVY